MQSSDRPVANSRVAIIIAAIMLPAVLTLALASRPSSVGPAELKPQIGKLVSLASEGRLLAEQSSQQRTTRAFAKTQTDMLADNTDQLDQSLNQMSAKATADIKSKLTVASGLTRQLKSDLEALSRDPTKATGDLKVLNQSATALEQSL